MKLPDWSKGHEERLCRPSLSFLTLLSFLYGAGVGFRIAVFKGKSKRSLPGFVVSIGNLTVGGTGKTPATCMLAEWALGEGYNVAVLSRGYRGSHRSGVLVLSDGNDINAGPDKAGDEPFLLARRLRGASVIVAKDRYQAGLIASKNFGADFFILDDGFQHLALKRDLDILLLDAARPFGNGRLLPRGPLREPACNLKRADLVILTRAGQSRPRDDAHDMIEETLKGEKVFKSDHVPEKVAFPFRNTVHEPGFLEGKRVVSFAGIARPETFRKTLMDLGAEIVFFRNFGDHHRFIPREIRELKDMKEQTGADYLITTEKDWVRLESVFPDYDDLGYLTIRFSILSGQETFFSMVRKKAGEKIGLKS